MRQTRILPVFAAALALVVMPRAALGDGGMIAKAPYWIHEHQQFAYLDWNEDAGREQLTVRPGFRGDARDFVWLMPVPSEPDVSVGDAALFGSLRAATDPIYRHRDEGWSCDRQGSHLTADSGAAVDILSERVIDVYHVLIVQATNAGALTDSLLAWGHLDAENSAEITPILQDYVAADWTFVAARIDSAAYAAAYPEAVHGNWYYGALRPLVFEFAADCPVYPMRLSRVSAEALTWVELYVEADHRYEHPRLDAVYANRISNSELEDLWRTYPLVAAELPAGRFLTRLQGEIAPMHMDVDYVLQRAGDDREFRSIRYSGWPATNVLLGGAVLVWAARKWRRRRRG